MSKMSAGVGPGTSDLANAVAQLQAEQSLLEKRCSAQVQFQYSVSFLFALV